MRKTGLYILMVMFLANTTLVSAWAKPCMTDGTEMSEISSFSGMGDVPPCHEENNSKKQDTLNHCEGVCLCLHVSLTQTPLLTDLVAVPGVRLGADVYNLSNESVLSRDYSPSNPPPIFIS
ncbi:MAG: hypothetical protein MRY79_05845 [Alphaproteobacteria bacterium]|nr:hypothetical protein [Alphaproteobacteria bacterium]